MTTTTNTDVTTAATPAEGRDDMTATLAPSPLTSADRCDRCSAQAYIRVTLAAGGELLFCAHHGRRHEAQLRPKAASWQDETDRLSATPASAADSER